jgi:type IV secretory pathway VirB10-like protein
METGMLRPPAPVAKRLNRNALILACGLLGITVLVAMVLVNPRRAADTPVVPVASGQPAPGRPTFLDEPVRMEAETAGPGAGHGVALNPVRASHIPELSEAWSPAREHAYRAALVSAAVIREPERRAGAPSAPRDTSPVAAEEEQLVSLGDSVLRTQGRAGSGTRPDHDHRGFLEALGYSRGAQELVPPEGSGSPYTLRAGSVIPGFLLTGVNSDLPGDLLGQVSEDVYDSRTERILLIPKGSRLLGTYDNRVVAGDDRLLVAWTRLVFPDGRSFKLPGLALTDRAGQAGIAGDVDTHWGRVFGKALLLSAIGAGAELSQPPATSVLATPSAGQVAAGALGQELSSVALELVRRGIDAPPTIKLPQGQAFNVFVNGDLVFLGPYEDDPMTSGRATHMQLP